MVRLFEGATDVENAGLCPDFIFIRFLKPADGARRTSDEVSPAVSIRWNTELEFNTDVILQVLVRHSRGSCTITPTRMWRMFILMVNSAPATAPLK